MSKLWLVFLLFLSLSLLAVLPVFAATNVDLELALLVDISGSVDSTDFSLQQTGYANAFKDATVIDKIVNSGGFGSIAATLVYFSDSATQALPWTLIDSQASAIAFGNSIAGLSRPFSGNTGIVNGLNFTSPLFNNDFNGTRNVIDWSGDGSETNACSFTDPVCAALQAARDAFLSQSITNSINALVINDRDFFGNTGTELINSVAYATTNVIGGPGAFVIPVTGFDTFQTGVRDKLIQEISPVPEPSTFGLLASGLAGILYFSRRLKRA
ncbi:conserved membrane hypothetical protein [Candidatus Sulfobium mesophilum]|uniref:VWFA domain-containing protein n=1 Tax=Candidatus Sulfobium mesophilum TaxID=2016548 RepID=A0A2U3QDH0_9BACT|nr:conserved membrane hypothetical protein [Candidatus Sulfobium mesophilum]